MNKKSIVFTVITVILLIIIIISSLGKKNDNGATANEVIQQNEALDRVIREYEEKISSLENTLKALTGELKTAIGSIDDGSNKKTFNTINDKIVFPKPFEYTGSTQASNTSSVNLATNVSIAPSNNWLIKLEGAGAKFSHPNGIEGEVVIGNIIQAIGHDKVQSEVLEPFLKGIPKGNVVYGKLFLDDNPWGSYANAEIIVDNEPGMLKIGALGIANTSIVYMFYYSGQQDDTKNELIDVMLRTMKVNNQQLRFN